MSLQFGVGKRNVLFKLEVRLSIAAHCIEFAFKAPTEDIKNDWLVALRSAKRPELYLEKNLDVTSAAAGATRRSVNLAAQQQNSASTPTGSMSSQLRSISGSTIASSDLGSPLASQSSLQHSNRDSKISR